MNIAPHAAIVTGGGSGLGEAVARELARRGARVAVLDVQYEAAQRVAADIGGLALRCDITQEDQAEAALEAAAAAHGPARMLMNIAGVGGAKRVIGKDGRPAPLADFRRVVEINLVGTYNMLRLFAARAAVLDTKGPGPRSALRSTSSTCGGNKQEADAQAFSGRRATAWNAQQIAGSLQCRNGGTAAHLASP